MTEIPDSVQNRLRTVRTRLGISQQALAAAAGVARQTVGGIEAGTYSVSMAVALRIARALGCRVDELFWLEGEPATVAAHPAGGMVPAGNALVAQVDGRWVAHGLSGESALRDELAPADGRWDGAGNVSLYDEPGALAATVLLAGCAPALSLWAHSAERWQPGLRAHWVHANSAAALGMLTRGEVHAAGLHFPAGNDAEVAAQGGGYALVELGVWQEGIALAPGNPKGIDGPADLARPDLALAFREPGAGSRAVLEDALAGAAPTPALVVRSHAAVARAVADGRADAGVTVEAVARALGLAFVPLRAVRYELALRRATLETPAVAQLVETLRHRRVRTQLAAVGGYDVAGTGAVRSIG